MPSFYATIPITDLNVQSALAGAGTYFDDMSPDHYHITLRYLPEVSKRDLSTLLSALEAAVELHRQFTLTISEPGFFPTAVWMGVEFSDPLMALQEAVDEVMQDLGYPPSDYPSYQPHITLAYVEEDSLTQPPVLVVPMVSWVVDRVDFNGDFTTDEDGYGDLVGYANLKGHRNEP